jgi:hypothetical protein
MARVLERAFVVKAPLAEAWRHLELIEHWPSWARHIRRIQLTPAGALTEASAGSIELEARA